MKKLVRKKIDKKKKKKEKKEPFRHRMMNEQGRSIRLSEIDFQWSQARREIHFTTSVSISIIHNIRLD
jgi:preprotein translocase subunit SecA